MKRKRTRNRRCAKNVYKFLKTAESKGIEVVFSQQIYDPSKLTWRQKKYYQKIITGKRRQFGAYTGKIKIPCVAGTFGAEYFNYNPPKSALFVKNNFDIWQNKKFAKFLDKKGIETLIITGVEMTCCVLYAILGAEERGFNIIVPKDLVSGVDEEMKGQKALLKIISGMYGAVVSSEEIVKAWG